MREQEKILEIYRSYSDLARKAERRYYFNGEMKMRESLVRALSQDHLLEKMEQKRNRRFKFLFPKRQKQLDTRIDNLFERRIDQIKRRVKRGDC